MSIAPAESFGNPLGSVRDGSDPIAVYSCLPVGLPLRRQPMTRNG